MSDDRRGLGSCDRRAEAAAMIAFPAGVRVWLAARPVEMRKGFDGSG